MFKWSAPWVWYLLVCVTEQGGDIKNELYLCMLSCSLRLPRFWCSSLFSESWLSVNLSLPSQRSFLGHAQLLPAQAGQEPSVQELRLQFHGPFWWARLSGNTKKKGKSELSLPWTVGGGRLWCAACGKCWNMSVKGVKGGTWALSGLSGVVGKWKQLWGSGLHIQEPQPCIFTLFCSGW